jgi:hypothetical protein
MTRTVQETEELIARVRELEIEVLEQCRLNGMGAERELALMARVRELEGVCAGMKEPAAVVSSPKLYSSENEILEALCARIKAADDAAADNGYMLDANDCISVLKGTWSGPLANDCPPKPRLGDAG